VDNLSSAIMYGYPYARILNRRLLIDWCCWRPMKKVQFGMFKRREWKSPDDSYRWRRTGSGDEWAYCAKCSDWYLLDQVGM